MSKAKALKFKIQHLNGKMTFHEIINNTIKASCKVEEVKTGEVKLTFEVFVNGDIDVVEVDLDKFKDLPEDLGYIILSKDEKAIPLDYAGNSIKLETLMDNSQLTLKFKLAAKAGGTSFLKAGPKSSIEVGKGGNTENNSYD